MSFRYPKGGFIQYFFDPLTVGPNINAGALYSWGRNVNGQLGQNNTTTLSSPIQVGSDTNWATIRSQNGFSVGIKIDGTLWGWGGNGSGQLGLNNINSASSPIQVGALTNWSKLSSSTVSLFNIAVKTDGTLWSWGRNTYGQLGDNSVVYRSSPVQIGSGTTWSQVGQQGAAGSGYAIKTDGTLWSWGFNGNGELAQNDLTYRSSPTQVGALTNWSLISGSNYFVLATKTDGTMWAWGNNENGQLGGNNVTKRSSPVQIGALTNWSLPSAGNSASFAIKTDGTLWSWGSNFFGQLGQNDTTYRSSPVQVGTDTNWSLVSGGGFMTGAVKTTGTLWLWGRNNYGQLGQNNTTYRSVPTQLGSGTSWGAVSAGNQFMMARFFS